MKVGSRDQLSPMFLYCCTFWHLQQILLKLPYTELTGSYVITSVQCMFSVGYMYEQIKLKAIDLLKVNQNVIKVSFRSNSSIELNPLLFIYHLHHHPHLLQTQKNSRGERGSRFKSNSNSIYKLYFSFFYFEVKLELWKINNTLFYKLIQ